MVSLMQRLSVAALLLVLLFIAITETSGNPGQQNDVADAIRYLQDLENKHQFARPRFGKRANGGYLTKEYTNNYLRYLLENPPEAPEVTN